MELEAQIDIVFEDLRSSVLEALTTVKEGRDRSVIDLVSKKLALSIYRVKLLLKEIDGLKPVSLYLQEELEKLRHEISQQNNLLSLFEKYDY